MLYLPVLAVVILFLLNVRQERDRQTVQHAYARIVLFTALVLLAVYALFWFVFGLGEIFGGELSGLIHLVPAVCVVLLGFLAHRRPCEGGIVLTALGAAQAVLLLATSNGSLTARLMVLVLAALPFGVVGALLLAARSHAPGQDLRDYSSFTSTSTTCWISGKNWRTVPATQPLIVVGDRGQPITCAPEANFQRVAVKTNHLDRTAVVVADISIQGFN